MRLKEVLFMKFMNLNFLKVTLTEPCKKIHNMGKRCVQGTYFTLIAKFAPDLHPARKRSLNKGGISAKGVLSCVCAV